jgi:arylsulfatase A
MNRREFLKAVGFGAAALGVPRALFGGQKKNPNIIFVMADDMGYGDVGCYNPESKIPTPNIDKLATEGVRFIDAHTPSAVCTPTRYGVLTGRYCWRSRLKRGVFGGFNQPLIEKDRMTVASLLKEHGYGTACIGKWHLGLNWGTKEERPVDLEEDYEQMEVDFSKPIKDGPRALGFDYFFGTAACTTDDPPFCFIENEYTLGIPNIVSPEDPADEDRELLMVPGWRHEDADIEFTNKATAFIKKQVESKPENPFFVYLPLSVPHIPWLPPDFVKGKSKAGPRGDQVVLFDWSVGQIVMTLDKLGISDNTLLIVTSDNGPREGINGHKSAGDLRGLKGSIWEGGHRVPFIAMWPGKIKADTTSDEVICLADLIATCAAIVGVELPNDAGQDSFNILPALLGEKPDEPIREAIVHHSGSGVFAIRQGEWKLILESKGAGYHDGPPKAGLPGQLYNLADDSYEKNDLWAKRPEIVKRLTKLLDKYKKQGYSRRA